MNQTLEYNNTERFHLKETVSRDFRHFLWAPDEQAKTGFAKFFVLRRYLQKTCVRVVNDYADTMSAGSMTMLTPLQRRQGLCGHMSV